MTRIAKILVPVDFSAPSRAALEHALFLAEKFEAGVHVLHSWHIPGHLRPDLTVWAGDISSSLSDHARVEAEKEMATFLADTRVSGDPRVTSEIAPGVPATSIVEAAKILQADLIVMGTHGRTGLSHLLLGSVAENVVRHARCPVLTVRGPKE